MTGPNPYRAALRQLRRTLLVVGVFSAVINVLMLTGPLYMLQVYDRVLSSGSVATLQGLFVIVVVLYGFLGLYEFLRGRLLSRASYRLDAMLNRDAFRLWVGSGVIGREATSQPIRDLEVVRGFLASPAVTGLFDAPWIPLYLGIVFLIHPWLGWLTIGGSVVVAIAALLNQWATRGSIAKAMGMDGAERHFLEQSRRHAETITSLGMLGKITDRWRGMHVAALAQSQEGGDRSEGFSAFSKSFRLLLQSALLTVGAYLALRQEISAGMIVATSIIAGRALSPVDQVIGQWRGIGRAAEAHRRLKTTFDEIRPEKPRIQLPAPTGALQVIRVTKLAPGSGPMADRAKILDRVSFELRPGDGLGVIGNSASGKSTLARLIVGAWTPELGEVRLDGATLDQWSPEDLGRFIGYLPQALEMMPGTIRDNIARFDAQASDDQVIAAAQLAGVHEMILRLPDGYATTLGGASQPLSGGQIQRLGLARAVFGTPKVVVLDEPNSNLDVGGDEALARAIATLRSRGSVVVVMAHRPSAIAAVNKVLILHNGTMAQFGDKEEVLAAATRPAAAAGVPAAIPAAGGAAAGATAPSGPGPESGPGPGSAGLPAAAAPQHVRSGVTAIHGGIQSVPQSVPRPTGTTGGATLNPTVSPTVSPTGGVIGVATTAVTPLVRPFGPSRSEAAAAVIGQTPRSLPFQSPPAPSATPSPTTPSATTPSSNIPSGNTQSGLPGAPGQQR